MLKYQRLCLMQKINFKMHNFLFTKSSVAAIINWLFYRRLFFVVLSTKAVCGWWFFCRRQWDKEFNGNRGSIAQWLACLLPDPAALGSIPSIPKYFSDKTIVDAAEVNQLRYLEESGQWLENVDLNHRALVSGKLVQQKIWPQPFPVSN